MRYSEALGAGSFWTEVQATLLECLLLDRPTELHNQGLVESAIRWLDKVTAPDQPTVENGEDLARVRLALISCQEGTTLSLAVSDPAVVATALKFTGRQSAEMAKLADSIAMSCPPNTPLLSL
jgi:hypothetical protein